MYQKNVSKLLTFTKRKSYKTYKNLQENLLYFGTFDITNISQSFTRKSHIESPGWKGYNTYKYDKY